ncbi:hypothetical protein PR048_003109 [Dryococelus australis]|uniref:Uncharacterized protein n=1 Tax=Dryococelus australis TaxID=614101 RepID=A0ABQ9ING4_9NEOP|nr:hypothetical protein PR048_003109 [Dryococelus australis]
MLLGGENVSILKLSPHATDVLQPLHVSCFKSLKYTRDLELVKWYCENQRKMTKSEFVSALCRVWNKGMKPENVRVGFMSTGLYQMIRDKYPVDRFDPEKYKRYKDCVQRDHPNSENEPAFQEQVHQDNSNLEPQSEGNETSDDSEKDDPHINELVNNNSSDIELYEPESDDFIQLQNPESLTNGDFILASFKGGKQGVTVYRYVDEFEVMGLKSDSDKLSRKLRMIHL